MQNNEYPVFYGAQQRQNIPFFRMTSEYKSVKDFIHNKVLAVFSNNAYRILDITVVATEEEIINKTNSYMKKIKLDVEIATEFGVDLFDDLIVNENLLLSARNRLLNPETRLKERLFWIINTDKLPISELENNYLKLANYLDIFYDAIHKRESSVTQLYSLSLMGLVLLAVDDYYLESVDSWTDVYNLIFYLIGKEEFWMLMNKIENKGKFSKTFAYSALEHKAKIMDIVIEPLILMAEHHIRNEDKRAFNALRVISKLNLDIDYRNKVEDRLLNIIEDDIILITDKIIDDCMNQIIRNDDSIEHNKIICKSALSLFNSQVLPKHNGYISLSVASSKKKRLNERIANFYKLMSSYFTWADDFVTAEDLLREAKTLVEVDSVDWIEIEERIKKISVYALLQRISKKDPKPNETVSSGNDNLSEVCPNCRKVIYAPIGTCPECKTKFDNLVHRKIEPQVQSNAEISNKKENSNLSLYIGLAIMAVIIMVIAIATASDPSASPDDGAGRVDFPDGYYIGDLADGVRHGHGEFYFSNGDKYEGQFKEGNFHGYGTLTSANSDKYVGDFEYGLFNGYGVFNFTNGNGYLGYFKDGSFHGTGTYTWADGTRFIGNWKNGDAVGRGTYHFDNGYRIESNSWSDLGTAINATFIYSDGMMVDGSVLNYEFIEY